MNNTNKIDKIKKYWEERAEQLTNVMAATTYDIFLRELEINTIIQTLTEMNLPSGGRVLDVGCGDGYSTIKIAQAFPRHQFFGIDYSENMIKASLENLEGHPELKQRITFTIGNVLELEKTCNNMIYDVVLSDRCLINLGTTKDQYNAIGQIAEHTKETGYYIAIENFVEGHNNMNEARRSVGLSDIPVRWHNLYFSEPEFRRTVKRFFNNIIFKDFASSYYFGTRVIYSKMCQMQNIEPDYRHEIHQLSIHLPWIGKYSPVRMAVMNKK